MKHDSCFLGPCLPSWFCERIPIVSTLLDADTRLASTMRHAHAYEAQSMTWSMTRSNAAWGTKHETWSSKWGMKHEAWNMMHNTWRGHDTWHEEGSTSWSKTWKTRALKQKAWHEAWHEATWHEKRNMNHDARHMTWSWHMTWRRTHDMKQDMKHVHVHIRIHGFKFIHSTLEGLMFNPSNQDVLEECRFKLPIKTYRWHVLSCLGSI